MMLWGTLTTYQFPPSCPYRVGAPTLFFSKFIIINLVLLPLIQTDTISAVSPLISGLP